MELKQFKHKYEMLPKVILEECWKEAQKELLNELIQECSCENYYIILEKKLKEVLTNN